jgi:ArsR family transcriptional regulator
MTNRSAPEQISSLLRAISQTARVEILLAIGTAEACVCHLESAIGQRQAYISQQLMALREAGIVTSRREGRNIYYRLKDKSVLDLVQHAGKLSGITDRKLPIAGPESLLDQCPCPQCSAKEITSKLGGTTIALNASMDADESDNLP